jgi:hypothetical protein
MNIRLIITPSYTIIENRHFYYWEQDFFIFEASLGRHKFFLEKLVGIFTKGLLKMAFERKAKLYEFLSFLFAYSAHNQSDHEQEGCHGGCDP